MKLIIYLVVYPIIWILSILPFRILYIFSDFIFLILYYVIGYRKEVVLYNLRLTFPEKEEKEIQEICRKFYHHFVDVFIEMLKTFTVSKEEVHKRYTFTNIDFFNDLKKNGKSVILMGPHYANWEWIMSLDSFADYKGYAAFTKINNPYFNKKVLKSRAKFGTHMVQTSRIISAMYKNKKNNIFAAYGLLSDQSPQLSKTFYWKEFFGIKVPVHTGAEMLAKRFDMNVVFIDTKKIKRGYYETTFNLISDDPKNAPNYELTDTFLKMVEDKVRKEPDYYLWTHKRFKHKDKAPKY